MYDVYTRAICSAGDTSYAANPLIVNTFGQKKYLDYNTECSPLGFVDISSTGQAHALGDDDETGEVMPFSFLFNGVVTNELSIGTNGSVLIGSLSESVNSNYYFGNSNNNKGLALFTDDLDVATGYSIYTESIGVAPNRVFVVQFEQVGSFSGVSGQTVTFQAQIWESNKDIYVVYDDVVFGGSQSDDDYANNADIGIQGHTNWIRISDNDSTFLRNNSCIHYFYTNCPPVSNFRTISSGTDSLYVTWDSYEQNQVDWTVKYGPTGFDPLTSGTTMNAPNDTITINGLSQLTEYDFYVYTNCTAISEQSNPFKGSAITKSECSALSSINFNSNTDSLFVSWNWTESSGMGLYPLEGVNIEYGYYNFEQGTGTVFSSNELTNDTLINELQGGGYYQIYLQGVCENSVSTFVGPYNYVLPMAPENDNVCNAFDLPVDGVTRAFSNQYASIEPYEFTLPIPITNANVNDGWANGIIHKSMWYTFEAPASGIVRIDGTKINQYSSIKVAVFESANCNDFSNFQFVAANEKSMFDSDLNSFDMMVCGLTPGQTYYILASSQYLNYQTFGISLSDGLQSAGEVNAEPNFCSSELVDVESLVSNLNDVGTWSQLLPTIVNVPVIINTDQVAEITNFEYHYTTSKGCASDTAKVKFKRYPANKSGNGSLVSTCEGTAVNLFSNLSGSIDLDGVWINTQNDIIVSGELNSANVGINAYRYITDNNVCPADTSTLTIDAKGTSSGSDVITTCESYTWIDGVNYTSSNNTATHTLTNALGCDSIVSLDLTINQPTTGVDVILACESYTWIDGVNYTSSNNTATHTLTNALGCDSIVSLDLTINQPTTGINVITACESYTWIDGVTYTSSNNTATHILINVAGCDSIISLDLTIGLPSTTVDQITACDEMTWIDGNVYTVSNNLQSYALTSATGCDSVVGLDLTILYSTTFNDTHALCEPFTWIDGVTYSESNNMAEVIYVNSVGCDSIVKLDLTIHTVETGVGQNSPQLLALANDAEFQWINCLDGTLLEQETNISFIAQFNGEYAVEVTQNGCVDTSACYSVFNVGIEESNLNQIILYPNPTSGQFKVSVNNGLELEYTLIDLNGKILSEMRKEKDETESVFDISTFSKGVYILKISSDIDTKIIRLVKE